MTTLIQAQPMLARRQIRLAAVAALSTLQGVKVITPGDLPTQGARVPEIKVRTEGDSKVSITRAMPEFTTTVHLVVEVKISATTEADAQDALELICYNIEQALLTNYALIGASQQVSSIETTSDISAEGRVHFGEALMRVSVETFEAYDPTATPPLATTWPPVTDPTAPFTGMGIHLDMGAPFDPNGTYTGTLFPSAVQPAPRTSGPDGRDEGALDIPLPQ
ncbi:MAG: hypothetical protein IE917_17895 [Betaproteobacteria bacterium]|nr:hypothetical protein [Betaproteobacteria bacterium]